MPLRVIRERPTDRNKLSGLSGVLTFSVEVREPVHIWGGMPYIEGLEELAARIKEVGIEEIGEVEEGGEEIRDLMMIGGKPVIPGSSLKGAVRSRLELSFREYNNLVPSCFSVTGPSENPSFIHREVYQSSAEDRGSPCDYNRYGTVCKVCDIFGAPGLASRVYFSNIEFYKKEIDLNRKIFVIPRGSKSKGEVLFSGLEPYELGLVLIGMGNERPLLIGAGKYRYEMGRILISPSLWRFTRHSKGTLMEIGVNFKEDGYILVDSDASKLWKRLVERAKREYENYLLEEDFDARAKKVSH